MKRSALFLSFIMFVAAAVSAQSNIFIRPENGEQYYLFLNGYRQNTDADVFIKVTKIPGKVVKAKIVFADSTLGSINKDITLPAKPSELTFVLKKANASGYELKWMGQIPMESVTMGYPGSLEIAYNTTAKPPVKFVASPVAPAISQIPGPDRGIDMHDYNETKATAKIADATNATDTAGSEKQPVAATPVPDKVKFKLPGYDGPVGCGNPMSDHDFQNAKNMVNEKPFEESKLQVAKQTFESKCLLSSQVKLVLELFSFEETRLDFAEFAYGRTFDIGSYYKINDLFQFSSSVDDLNEYIQKYKK